MNSIEKKAATVDEAIALALTELNAKIEDCFVEVYDEGAVGHILGIGRRDAHVCVTLDLDGEKANANAANIAKVEEELAKTNRRERERRPSNGFENRREGRNNRNNECKPRGPRYQDNTEVPAEANVAMDYIAGLLTAMDIHGKMNAYMRGETICIDVIGDNVGGAIGFQGSTLDAINRLTRIAVSKDHHVKLVVDIGGYRRRRERELRQLVQSTAQEAAHLDIEIQLEPMNAMDRRYVHASLMKNPDVGTYSVGEGSKRAVVIAPTHLVPETSKRPEHGTKSDSNN